MIYIRKSKLMQENRKLLLWIVLFEALLCIADLVMYYAAGFTLNAIYAALGVLLVPAVALAASLGALIGKYLFTYMKDTMKDEWLQLPFEKEEEEDFDIDAAEKESGLMKRAVDDAELITEDTIKAIAVFILTGIVSLPLLIGLAVSLVIRMTDVLKEKGFIRRCLQIVPVFAGSLMTALLSVQALSSGRAGLYALIMSFLIMMDLQRSHIRAAEKTEESFVLPSALQYAVPIALRLSCVLFWIAGVQRIWPLLSRTGLLGGRSSALFMILSAVTASACACFEIPEEKKDEWIISFVPAGIAVLAAVHMHLLTGLIVTSGLLAVYAAVPVLKNMSQEDDERLEAKTDARASSAGFLFLILLCAFGYLLYWNGSVSFVQLLNEVILFMAVFMFRRGSEE